MRLPLNINSKQICHFPQSLLTFMAFWDPCIYIFPFSLNYSDLFKTGRDWNRNSWVLVNLYNSDMLLFISSWQNSFWKSLPYLCPYSHSYPPMGNLENKCPQKKVSYKKLQWMREIRWKQEEQLPNIFKKCFTLMEYWKSKSLFSV